MAKIADVYYKTDPWKIIEEGFDSEYSEVSESVFSLGNEYMGVRGYFEEGYSGDSLIGSYFNGIYEAKEVGHSAYKGMIDKTEFIVNSVDWLYLRIQLRDEVLDLKKSDFRDFKRVLNLHTGVLNRSFIWITKEKKQIKLEFERFLSMKDAKLAGQRLKITPLNFSGKIQVTAGLDFTQIHHMAGENLWDCKKVKVQDNRLSILADTKTSGQSLCSSCMFNWETAEENTAADICTSGTSVVSVSSTDRIEEKRVLKEFFVTVSEGKEVIFTRVVQNIVRKNSSEKDYTAFQEDIDESKQYLDSSHYESIKKESITWWEKAWIESDIIIEGDELNQQGIRFCIFQMHQTYHGADKGTIIGAKGLTGEAYSGNTFWDTETYCLPFYIFNNKEAARHLLEFRSITLPEAKKRAKALDCEGAFYPIATITGRECCSLWQHASLQLQASTAVAYGFRHYERVTDDEDFIYQTGLSTLIEVSRMLATRGDWSGDKTRYGFYGVMGPDEFQMMIHNNCYTNYLGKMTLEYTLDVINRLRHKDSGLYSEACRQNKLSEEEIKEWQHIADHIYVPYDASRMIFEQHEGYFNLPHVDINKIPVEDFPLYHHWTYDRIYRNDMIKQPDVLMMMFLFNGNFTKEQIQKNYEYYEPRCIHESSLSPSVHSILAAQIGKAEEAYKFFGFATRMDLDNYNRNTAEGLHTTSIAAAWMNIVYGFAGMRSDKPVISFAPTIPKEWNGYSFRLYYKEDMIEVKVDKDYACFYTVNGTKLEVIIYDEVVQLGKEEFKVPISAL